MGIEVAKLSDQDSIYSVLIKAKREGRLTDELRREIIDTKKYL